MISRMSASGNHVDPAALPASRSLRALVDWSEAILDASNLTYGHGTDNPRDEAAWLVLAALGLSPVDAAVDPDMRVDEPGCRAVRNLLVRRITERRPVAYLTGRAWFAGLEFAVDERVLVPRSPLAEPIVDRFHPWIGQRPAARILEIGTGSGCIAIACAHAFPEAAVDATDTDPDALDVARDNVRRHDVADRVRLHRADVYAGLPGGRHYDLIVSNPPYVDAPGMAALPAEYRHEPAHALAAGHDGLDVATRIVAGAAGRLSPDGLLALEVGRAAVALERRFPGIAFTWLTFAHGGDGVGVIGGDELAGH